VRIAKQSFQKMNDMLLIFLKVLQKAILSLKKEEATMAKGQFLCRE
jgi:hypothetical protein